VLIAELDLQRHQHGQKPQGHRQHSPALGKGAAAPQIEGGDRDNDKPSRNEAGVDHVSEAVGKGGAEHHRPPIRREKAAVDDLVARRGLHPRIRGKDPERRKQRPSGNGQRGDDMRPLRHQGAPEQEDAQKARFEKEGGQHLVGHQRPDDVGRRIREAAPIGAELERHDDPRDDAEPEGDRKDPQPERRDAEINPVAGAPIAPFEQSDVAGQPDRERRQQDVQRDDPEELQA
jgi:hypothetical protein